MNAGGPEKKGRPPLDEARARELLGRERERIERSLAAQRQIREGELDEIRTATDIADDAGLIGEEQFDEALAEQLRAELEAVERAEKRLEDGTYGFSIESGEPIPAGRLEAIPWAERTAEEQETYERRHGSGP
ncbi:MAG TPA: TraR/DksA family transcriptional regulator [Solirubrobacterales bacterium]